MTFVVMFSTRGKDSSLKEDLSIHPSMVVRLNSDLKARRKIL
jgi:hypothetical protein